MFVQYLLQRMLKNALFPHYLKTKKPLLHEGFLLILCKLIE